MLINLKNIQKTYNTKTGVSFRAISNVSLSFDDSGMVFLLGKSGSGKTTLLNLIGGMDSVDSGAIYIGGKNLARLTTAEVDSYRNTMVGFVFQEFNLIDYMTVFENVQLALDMQSDKDNSKVEEALKQVDLLDKKHEKVKNLSGGQRQRVGIARAVVKNPDIILADEPTGALDSATGDEVMKIFERLSKQKLVIMVSHDAEKAVTYADRIIEMKDGTIYRDVRRKKEGEKIDYNQIHITSNTLIRLEKGVTLKDDDVEQINEILNQKGRRAYINVDTNPQKIKAMFPNLREAVDGGNVQKPVKTQKLSDNGDIITGKEGFIPYKPNNDEIKKVNFKKSNLPSRKALKIGLANLKLKVAKMIVTIVIAVIAFTLFATAISFQGYDLTSAYSKTIRKSNHDYIMAINAAGTRFRITEHEINDIKAANPKISVHEQYTTTFYSNIQNHFQGYSLFFNSFIETEDATDLGLEMLEGTGSLEDFNSIIISQAAAREYIRFGEMKDVELYGDLIGKYITLRKDGVHSIEYKIAGIFKSKNMEKYEADPYDDYLYNDLQNYIEGVLIVKQGFRQDLAEKSASLGVLLSINHTGTISYDNAGYADLISNNSELCKENGIGIDYNITSYSLPYYDIPDNIDRDSDDFNADDYLITPNPLDYDNFELADNQIFISTRLLSQYELYVPEDGNEINHSTKITDFNSDSKRNLMLSNVGDNGYGYTPYYFSTDMQIKGIIRDGRADIIFSENTVKRLSEENIYASKVLLTLSGDKKADSALIDYLHGSGYKVESAFASSYQTLLSFVSLFRTTLIVFSILLCALVVLLLFTFISSSIKLTRKQIGILRAIGARRIDTFKIFALEGIVIGLISFAITTALVLIFAPILNALISVKLGYYFSALTIGIKDILSVLLLMLIVTVISILIPLRKFNKITPIKAIVEKE